MGAEVSRPTTLGESSGDASGGGMRRVGSTGALPEHQKPANGAIPMSASTTALSALEAPRRNSAHGRSASAVNIAPVTPPKNRLLDNPLFNSMRRVSSNRAGNGSSAGSSVSGSTVADNSALTSSMTWGEDNVVESLDLPIVEWEGYVTKRGHLVRNWKMRFFTLEGNNLSYYENKVDARNRDHLKGRVNVASVKKDKVAKSGHGFEFSFETTEGKVFHCSVPTEMEQLAWVYFLEAGVDCSAMKKNSKPVYNTYRHGRLPDMRTEVAYDVFRRLSCGEVALTCEFMAYFNKDTVFSTSFPKTTPFQGDFFGREGLLHFLGVFYHSVDILEFTVTDVKLTSNDGKSLTISGKEKLQSKVNGETITQAWTHRVQLGPYGRVLKMKVELDPHSVKGSWSSFGFKNPYSEMAGAATRSTRSLSISLKDFTVYNVIGKGGFGTVVNAVKKSDGQIYALKILEKGKMTKYDIESSFTEMRVAQNIHHPFVAGLRIAFQSRTKLFLGMNYYGGGDLFHHMSKGASCRIPEARAHFYTAELVLGIHHLHQHDILYRDIKPENVMIDGEGHIALVDFGLAKLHVSNYYGAKTMAGSPQYTAPELLLPKAKRSYGKAADWWSLGILLYEMSVGKSPFYDSNIEKMYQRIQHEPLTFPSKPVLSESLKDILSWFLQKDATKRLGSNISDILEHPYFTTIDWDLLLKRKMTPPWKPNLASPLDVEYVDQEFTDLDVSREVQSPTDKSSKSKGFLSLVSSRNARKAQPPAQDPTFKDFTYFCEDPDALVEVTNLVHELHPTPPPPPPTSSLLSSSSSSSSDDESNRDAAAGSSFTDASGTPLSSFVENGRLDVATLARSPEFLHKSIKSLEEQLATELDRVEVTISRERPAHLQKKESSSNSEDDAGDDMSSQSSSSDSSATSPQTSVEQVEQYAESQPAPQSPAGSNTSESPVGSTAQPRDSPAASIAQPPKSPVGSSSELPVSSAPSIHEPPRSREGSIPQSPRSPAGSNTQSLQQRHDLASQSSSSSSSLHDPSLTI